MIPIGIAEICWGNYNNDFCLLYSYALITSTAISIGILKLSNHHKYSYINKLW